MKTRYLIPVGVLLAVAGGTIQDSFLKDGASAAAFALFISALIVGITIPTISYLTDDNNRNF